MRLMKLKAKLSVENKCFRLQANVQAGEKEYCVDHSIPVKTVALFILPIFIPAGKAALLKYLPKRTI